MRALSVSSNEQFPTSWTPDGQELIFWEDRPETGSDIFALPFNGGMARLLVGTEHHETLGAVSPDGRWLAYVSDITGRPEIWVKAYANDDAPTRISQNGGTEPVWSSAGAELFYLERDRMMSVSVATGTGFRFQRPDALFEGGMVTYQGAFRHYDVGSDGRFVIVRSGSGGEEPQTRTLVLVLNWVDELKPRLPGLP